MKEGDEKNIEKSSINFWNIYKTIEENKESHIFTMCQNYDYDDDDDTQPLVLLLHTTPIMHMFAEF